LQNALEELSKQRLDGSLSSSFSSAGSSEVSNSVGESWCAILPAVKQLYEYVHVDHPHDPVSDRDDSSLGEGRACCNQDAEAYKSEKCWCQHRHDAAGSD
jgi:hypothetical protein